MKLSDKQRDHLWNTLRGCGCSEEWLMHHGEYLCENVAALIERPPVATPEVVYRDRHSYSSGGSDYGLGVATGLIIGDMFG